MRLHRLTFEAVGPFLGLHEIDFDRLNQSSLFLLEGKTGSGKSTVLDLISFALYGRVASESSSDDRIRSGYAPGNVESFVDLIFSTPQGIYRVYRTPSWERAKKDGTGTTRQPAIGKLWKLEDVPAPGDDPDDAQVIAVRMDEIAAAVQNIIGLDRKQFAQTILLPQGEFASFLGADPEQRRSLLQRVFGTQVYEDLAKQLAAMASEAKKRLSSARSDVQAAAKAFAAVTESTGVEIGWEALPDEDTALTAKVVVEELRSGVSKSESRLRALIEQVTTARAEYESAKHTLDVLTERADALATIKELSAHENDVRRWREQVESSRLARNALRFVDDTNRAKHSLEAARSDADALRGELTALLNWSPDEAQKVSVDHLQHLASQYSTDAGRLESLLATEATLGSRHAEVGELAERVEAGGVRAAELETRIAETNHVIDELIAKRERTVRTVGDRHALEHAVADAEELSDAVRHRDGLAARLTDENTKLAALVESARGAASAEASVRDAWLSSLAGHLARDLVDGQECAVCGSESHPNPAKLPEGAPGRQDVQNAVDARLGAESLAAEQSELVKHLKAELAAAKSIAGRTTVRTAETRAAQARKTLETSIAAQSEQRSIDEQVADAKETLTQLRTSQASVTSRLEYLSQRLSDMTVELQSDEEKIAAALSKFGDNSSTTVSELRDTLAYKSTLASRMAEALGRLDAAEATYVSARDRLLTDIEDAGFATSHDARAAVLDEPTLVELEAKVTAWDKNYAAANARLEGALNNDVPRDHGLEPKDIDRLDQRASELSIRLGELELRKTRLDERLAVDRHVLASASTELEKLSEAVEASKSAAAAADPVIRMAGLANGTKPHSPNGLSLATYVLVRRFEQVMDAANGRLITMSDGRYELVRSDTKEDVRTHRIGLAMKVVDHATETARDPRTLSGGEKFYVSLCLALGLADVVTAEAGGVDLGTLFIDEGFGSLDQETLDCVLTELRRLSSRGRTIGVVSHVEQMKQSIAERVEVRPRADGRGSTLRIVA